MPVEADVCIQRDSHSRQHALGDASEDSWGKDKEVGFRERAAQLVSELTPLGV